MSGAGWPCETVQIAPSWSEPIRKTVTDYSFTEPVPVPATTELGSQTITVTCLVQYFLVSKSTTITIHAVPVVNSSTPDTSSPQTSVPETSVPQTSVPQTSVTPTRTAPQPAHPGDNRIRDILAIAALLVAIGVALLVLRLRRGRPPDPADGDRPDPHPSRIRVRVAADPNPAIHVRELDTRSPVPGIRVRLATNEPQLHVREVRR
ncbi:hypothetical protein [Nocardia tengchongensis]|uniref:hypothetical protein n=1 Tax=Nocardia tengchongensis TaxID=2055889 RepID=UPI00361D5A76